MSTEKIRCPKCKSIKRTSKGAYGKGEHFISTHPSRVKC